MTDSKMIARVIPKKNVQAMIKALRAAKLNVAKTDSGYECSLNGALLFQAMNGRRNYLVRMRADLFEE
jgi:hypothetical protein